MLLDYEGGVQVHGVSARLAQTYAL